MILEVKEIININSVATIRDKFPNIENFSESELEETILSEPEVVISTVCKKAARIDPRYFVLLKTEQNLLALHLALNYFLIVREGANKRVEVCLGKQDAEFKYINHVKNIAIDRGIEAKYFKDEKSDITYEYCERVAQKLKQFDFEIELIHTK